MRLEKNNSNDIRSASERRKMYSQQYSLVVSLFSWENDAFFINIFFSKIRQKYYMHSLKITDNMKFTYILCFTTVYDILYDIYHSFYTVYYTVYTIYSIQYESNIFQLHFPIPFFSILGSQLNFYIELTSFFNFFSFLDQQKNDFEISSDV